MISYEPLTTAEEMLFTATVEVEKEKVREQAAIIAADYEKTEADKLVKTCGLSVGEALSVVHSRRNGTIESDDLIHFQDGRIVPVADIVSDVSAYDKMPCADPCEPDEGASRAMFFANVGNGHPTIHSFLHGGQLYRLGDSHSPKDEAENEQSLPTVKELLELTDILGPEDTDGVKDLLSMAEHLDGIDLQQLLTRIKKQTRMTMEAMRSYLHKRSNSQDDSVDHLKIARKMIENIGSSNVLADEDGVYIWLDRGVWKMMEKGDLRQRAQRAVEEHRSVMAPWVGGVVEVFTNEVYRPNHQFNIGNPEVINCLNGELHLDKQTGKWELKPHDRESFRTSQIPVKFAPAAKAPLFERFLGEIFEGDHDSSDKAKALMEMMGYTMVAHCSYEMFILLIGSGANGKSVVLSVLEALVGSENTVGVQPSQFENPFQRAHLQHKLANIVTEIKQGEVIADAALKGIVSGEPSTVENKFKDPFTLRSYATCWFATNHMPHTRDYSDALFRRALILKFNRVFTDDQKKPNLKNELIVELPGILNLALEAYGNAVLNGFTKPESSEKAREEWRLEADQVQQFIEECCVREPYAEMEGGRLYKGYQWWAEENGIHRTLTQKSFRERLTRLEFGARRASHARYVTGIDRGDSFPRHI